MILGDHEDSENSLKRKESNALSAAQRRGGGEPEQYAIYRKIFLSYRLGDKKRSKRQFYFWPKLCKF
jgi:hypothetical protein